MVQILFVTQVQTHSQNSRNVCSMCLRELPHRSPPIGQNGEYTHERRHETVELGFSYRWTRNFSETEHPF